MTPYEMISKLHEKQCLALRVVTRDKRFYGEVKGFTVDMSGHETYDEARDAAVRYCLKVIGGTVPVVTLPGM